VVEVGRLDVGPGEQVLIKAPSGAGKSTLLHLIAGVLEPTRGTIEITGKVIHALRGSARDRFRGQHIGMIFQTFQLLDGFTARENVEMALLMGGVRESEHAERANSFLGKLGLNRLDVPIGELSVGQQQRVAVARAVACRPALVLADEPTASLDVENGALAMDLIQQACSEIGAALVCVSHDPAMDMRFDRRVDLDQLRAAASGVAL
jgi:ABC-type lipoprotein export system ATPase subunit